MRIQMQRLGKGGPAFSLERESVRLNCLIIISFWFRTATICPMDLKKGLNCKNTTKQRRCGTTPKSSLINNLCFLQKKRISNKANNKSQIFFNTILYFLYFSYIKNVNKLQKGQQHPLCRRHEKAAPDFPDAASSIAFLCCFYFIATLRLSSPFTTM